MGPARTTIVERYSKGSTAILRWIRPFTVLYLGPNWLRRTIARHFPFDMHPVSSSPFASQPTPNPETGPPVPLVGLDDAYPSHRQASTSPDKFIHVHLRPHSFIRIPTTTNPRPSRFSSVYAYTRPNFLSPSNTYSPCRPLIVRGSPTFRKSRQQSHHPSLLSPFPLHKSISHQNRFQTPNPQRCPLGRRVNRTSAPRFIPLPPPSIIDTRMPEDSTNIRETAAARWCF